MVAGCMSLVCVAPSAKVRQKFGGHSSHSGRVFVPFKYTVIVLDDSAGPGVVP